MDNDTTGTEVSTEADEYVYSEDVESDGTEYPAQLDLTTESSFTEAVEAVAGADGDGEMRYGDEGEDVEHDNTRRAGFALRALIAYWQHTGLDNDLGTALGDMLSDLRHLADAVGEDFDDFAEAKRYHYDAELTGDL